jgi:20S proteasome subunit alpha 6
MWRNQYDQDCLTWSPEGKIMQIDYAMEAVRQGSISIGLKSDEYAILMGLKRSPHIMSGYQEKIFKIDDHIGVAISGITADGRIALT